VDTTHVVYLLVEASTFYAAVAKGAAGATLLTKADRDPAVDDCQLIYDLDTKPAVQLTDKWPSLPKQFESPLKAVNSYSQPLVSGQAR